MTAFSARQDRYLLLPVDENRILTRDGQSYLAQWDVRRYLNRTFGFGGWSFLTTSVEHVFETEHPASGNAKSRWSVCYRATGILTIPTYAGKSAAKYGDTASGHAQNQPDRGRAHDQAMKTAVSDCLKRCAVNLGDQFGLGLYNKGKSDPVVKYTMVSEVSEPEATDDPVATDLPDVGGEYA